MLLIPGLGLGISLAIDPDHIGTGLLITFLITLVYWRITQPIANRISREASPPTPELQTSSRLSTGQLRQLLIAQGRSLSICQECGLEEPDIMNVHHIIPISEGGTNNASNLIVLCPNCHTRAHKEIREHQK
ncbi:HNH endonuclease [Gemmatimonadota bacterium]